MDSILTILHTLTPSIAEAQNQVGQFVPLSKGFMQLIGNNISLNTDGFGPFINSLFKLSIRIAGALAVAMFVWGGITYMTQPFGVSEGGVGEAKARMQNAVLGLLMLLATWVIFNQINPDILNLKINAAPLKSLPAPTSTNQLSDTGVPTTTGGDAYGGLQGTGNILKNQSTGECFSVQQSCTTDGVCIDQTITTACP